MPSLRREPIETRSPDGALLDESNWEGTARLVTTDWSMPGNDSSNHPCRGRRFRSDQPARLHLGSRRTALPHPGRHRRRHAGHDRRRRGWHLRRPNRFRRYRRRWLRHAVRRRDSLRQLARRWLDLGRARRRVSRRRSLHPLGRRRRRLRQPRPTLWRFSRRGRWFDNARRRLFDLVACQPAWLRRARLQPQRFPLRYGSRAPTVSGSAMPSADAS